MIDINGILVRGLIDALTKEGEVAIITAYNNRGFKNQTYNLHDSYGSAVFANGKVIKSTIRYLGAEQARTPHSRISWEWGKGRSMPDFRGERREKGDSIYMRGRDEIMDFFSQYTPKTKGIELVIAAAMYYAGFLEGGTSKAFRKIEVISGATNAMQSIASKYNGRLSDIRLGRVLSVPTTIKNKTWQ